MPRRLRLLGLGEVATVVRGRAPEQRVQSLAQLAPGSRGRILVLGLKLHPKPVGKRLERPLEVESLRLHDEAEGITRGLTTEAVVVLLVRSDVEGGGALLVKRA